MINKGVPRIANEDSADDLSGPDLATHLDQVEQTDRRPVLEASRNLMRGFFAREKIKPDEVLLELGCGTGYLTRELVPEKFKDSILQTDPSAELLKEARRRFPQGRYQILDAMNMPEIPDESVDRIFTMCVLNYLSPEQIRLFLQEARRVLRKGGKFYSFLDLQPNDACIREHMAQRQGIPLEYAVMSKIMSGGITLCKIIDSRVQDSYATGLSAILGGESSGFIPTAPYLVSEILIPLFQEFFPSEKTKAELFSCNGALPFLSPFVLVIENTVSRIHGLAMDLLGKSILLRHTVNFCPSGKEVSGYFLGRFRTLQHSGMYLNIGAKE